MTSPINPHATHLHVASENPKLAFGDLKPCAHYVPMNVMVQVAEVMRGGADKYGLKNWRRQPIRASTYYDAMFRHMVQWFEGLEDQDAESQQHHLAHVVCCAMLVLDSLERGILVDDRRDTEVLTQNNKD